MPRKDKGGGQPQVYKNLKQRAEEGDYDFVLPLDARLMEKFPKEGELFGGLYPLTKTADQVRKEFDPELPIKIVFPRLRALRDQGLLVNARTLGDRRGTAYQITEAGQRELKKIQADEKGVGKEEDGGGANI